jgi:NAD(P)H-flavin reductase
MYPPITLNKEECERIDNVVFIAGGVGVNPVMSMIGGMDAKGVGGTGGMVRRVRALYGSKREKVEGGVGRVLFGERLEGIARRWEGRDGVDFRVGFWETGDGAKDKDDGDGDGVVTRKAGRITHEDLFEALGPEGQRENMVVYVCGVPEMTDEFVEVLRRVKGMDEKRVLCEKWW